MRSHTPRGPGTAPLDTACAGSSIAAGPGLETAAAGSACTFTVLVKDKAGNKRSTGGDIVVARLVERSTGRIAAEGHVVDNTDGSYYCSYVPTRFEGDISLRVTVNGTKIQGSPFRPEFVAGPVAGRCCTASGAGLHDGITGRPCEFELQARDSFGNPVAGGGGGPFKMEVRMRTPACAEMRAEAMPVQKVEARDIGDGTYTLQWCAEVVRVRVS